MDELDIKLFQDLSESIDIPLKYDFIIKNVFNDRQKRRSKLSIKSIVLTLIKVLGAMFLTSGVVFAATKVYEKIWKEPKAYTYEEIINELPAEKITEEEKQDLITEDEAKEKGLEILELLGYENETIERVELKRGYSEDISSYYMVKTKYGYEEGLMVQLNAYGGDFISFDNMDLKYKHLESEELSNDEIEKIATDVYNKFELENTYEIYNINTTDLYFENQASKLLQATFCKFYNGIANQYEYFSVSFMSVNGEIYLNNIKLNTDSTYQNNDVVISKEQAINIATSKEQELSPYEILSAEAELSIEKMNTFIYLIENDLYDVSSNMEDETYYETEDVTRNVWKITISHSDVDLSIYQDEDMHSALIKEATNKVYFVDATTGEIIGGEWTK